MIKRIRLLMRAAFPILLAGCVTGPGGVQVGDWKSFNQEAVHTADSTAYLPVAITVPVAVLQKERFSSLYNQGQFANYIKPGFVACNSGPVIHPNALPDAISATIYFSEYLYRVLTESLPNPIILQPYLLTIDSDGNMTKEFVSPLLPTAISLDYFTYVNPSHVYACATTFGNIVTPIVNLRTWQSISPVTGGLLVADRTTSRTARAVGSGTPVGSGYAADIVSLLNKIEGDTGVDLNTDATRKAKLPLSENKVVVLPAGWLWANFSATNTETQCGIVHSIERGHDTFLLAAIREALRIAEEGNARDKYLDAYRQQLGPSGNQIAANQLDSFYLAEVKARSYMTSRYYDAYRTSKACHARRLYVDETREATDQLFSASMSNAAFAGASTSSLGSAMVLAGNQDRQQEAQLGSTFADASIDLLAILRRIEEELTVGNHTIVAGSITELRSKMVELSIRYD